MTSRAIAAKQARRLSGLDFAPDADGRAEVLEALRIASASPDHCCTIATVWLERNTRYPKPTQIYELANELRESDAPPPCKSCQLHPGQIVIERHIKSYLSNDILAVSGVDYCTCPRGAWLRKRSQSHAHPIA